MSLKKKTAYKQGVYAEKIVATYLRLKGYKVLEHRYKTPVGEVDVIARKGDALIFVEVKSYRDEEQALYAVTPKTRRRIEAAAMHYVAEKSSENTAINDMGMRFDVVVVPNNRLKILGGRKIQHLDNAWFCGE